MLLEQLLLAAALWGPATAAAPPAADDDDKAKAVEYSKRGLEAARREDYQQAIEMFEAALALRPSPRLYYNIAVSYHRIYASLPEGDLNRREDARSKAVEAYNRYLEADPDAPDRDDVGRTVIKLGGRPASLDDWSIEPSGDDDPEKTPTLRDDEQTGGDEAPPEPDKPPPELPDAPVEAGPEFPRGRFGFGFAVTAANLARMSDVDDVASLPFLGGLLRGGAFIGRKRRVNLGGELTIAGQPTSSKARHFLTSVTGVFAAEYGHPIGKKNRIEIGAGGVSGLYLEQLRHNGTTTVTCANRSSLPSSRAGFLLAGRFNLVFLLGKNRNHELGLRLTPGLGLPAEGTKGDNDPTGVDCGSEADAFKQLQVDGPELVVTFDIGYAPRF